MTKEKIHKLLDLALEIQMRREGENGFPYVSIAFSNFGSGITVHVQNDGFEAEKDYDYADYINFSEEKKINNAINALEETLQIAVDQLGA